MLIFNVLAKATVVSLGLLVFIMPSLPQFLGKLMMPRFFLFMAVLLAIPALWFLAGRPKPYPHVADALIAIPFGIDMVGNSLGAYALFWFDDIVHFVSPLVFGFVLIGFFNVFIKNAFFSWLSAAGVLNVGHIIFEIGEYLAEAFDSTVNFGLSYEDTLRDLGMGVLATFVLLAFARLAIRSGIGASLIPLFTRRR